MCVVRHVNLSIHPARVTARRLPPSAEPSGSSRYDPVGPSSTAMTCPLRSTGITPLRRYYEAVRPSPAHRYFRPRGWSRLRPSLRSSPARFSCSIRVVPVFAPLTCRMPWQNQEIPEPIRRKGLSPAPSAATGTAFGLQRRFRLRRPSNWWLLDIMSDSSGTLDDDGPPTAAAWRWAGISDLSPNPRPLHPRTVTHRRVDRKRFSDPTALTA